MLIIGCGAVGRRLAQRIRAAGGPVTGTVRSAAGAATLAAAGVDALRLDLDETPVPHLPTAGAAVFYLVPPPPRGDSDERLRRFLAACARDGQPRRIVAISTTGVYGDCAGAWVDEHRPANPQVDRAKRRWDAERQLMAWREASGGQAVVLRVAGIYGPGKLPLERLRRGDPMISAAEAPWTNRIHIDDLVTTCLAAMDRGRDGEVYNACDGQPGNMADYFARVAAAAGLPRPPEISRAEAERTLSPGMLSYLGESRRLSNRKLVEELGVELRYPTLAEGLAASLAAARETGEA
ncbi:MAG: SDR family oxidoreductase [Gammaproteobacteria bacterium]